MRKTLVIACFLSGWQASGQDTTSLSLVFVGDIMQHESQMKAAFDPQLQAYDYRSMFRGVHHLIQPADLAIGNLEFTFGGKPYAGYPAFSAPDELAPAIRDAGFDVMVTANNHSVDRGRIGLERTLRILDSVGLQHTGTFVDTLDYLDQYPLVVERKGFRISLLNYTYGTNGLQVRAPNIVNRIDTTRIREDLVKAAKQGTDAVIVVFHWGDEYVQQPTEAQRRLADLCLANGALMVIGSHPHVLQPMVWDREKGKAVFFSLGNFVSGQRARYRNGGAIAHITLQKSSGAPARIADVSYSLVWVYRAPDARRTFQLIPVPDPVDTLAVQGSSSRSLLLEFARDARTFLDRENTAVPEKGRKPDRR